MLAVGVGVAIGYYAARDGRYIVQREGQQAYLVDVVAKVKQPIMPDFQLGDVGYRLKGVLSELELKLVPKAQLAVQDGNKE